jgi:hypothetical protein
MTPQNSVDLPPSALCLWIGSDKVHIMTICTFSMDDGHANGWKIEGEHINNKGIFLRFKDNF